MAIHLHLAALLLLAAAPLSAQTTSSATDELVTLKKAWTDAMNAKDHAS